MPARARGLRDARLGAHRRRHRRPTARAANPINDQGSSYDYRSNITAITPSAPGLSVEVLEFADRLLLRNHTGKTVTIYGYEGEPYARVLANGTAEQNMRAPATYLNTNFYANVAVPSSASASAPPQVGSGRSHGRVRMARSPHPLDVAGAAGKRQEQDQADADLQLAGADRRGEHQGAIDGQLFWTPENSKAPLAVIILGVVIVLGGLLFVVFVRRRRARASAAAGWRRRQERLRRLA